MENPKTTSDVNQTSKARRKTAVKRLVSKRVIKKLERDLCSFISKEKKLLSKIADNNIEISDFYKSGEPVTVSGIRVLENENLEFEIELDKIRDKQTDIENRLVGKLDNNDSILRSRRIQK